MTTHPVEFQPLENAADFLLSAADHLVGEPGARDLKYATLHIVAAVEILLKVRLAREHFSLVFNRLGTSRGRSEMQQWEEGDFGSVNAPEAIRRLRHVSGLDLPDDIPGFERLRELRNQLTHHGVCVAPQMIQTNAIAVLDFALTFIDQHLREDDESLPPEVVHTLDAIGPRLAEVRGLVAQRLRSIQPAIDKAPIAMTCPDCAERTLVPGDKARCLFCLAEYPPSDAASEWIQRVLGISAYGAAKDGDEYPLYYCPSCGQESLVHVLAHDFELGPEVQWVCFAEGETFSSRRIRRCERCNEPTMTSGGDLAVCEICTENLLAE